MNATQAAPASAFFLPGARGARFCLFHAPAPDQPACGAFIYLHPFAEEMNCARRIAAQQSRALAALGFGVLQIDLFGCGDSDGEFSDADWAAWRDDASDAADWLGAQGFERINLWGVRLGALLALDVANRLDAEHLLLWQPTLNGKHALTQFLRIALAGQALGGSAVRFADTGAMRAALAAGEMIEIAGYPLASALAADLDALEAANLPAPRAQVHWLERSSEGLPLTAASERQLDRWRAAGTNAHGIALPGATAFWSTPGHTTAPEFNAATAQLLAPPP